MIKKFLTDESGPTIVEYAVLVALIVIVTIPALTILGHRVRHVFEVVSRALDTR